MRRMICPSPWMMLPILAGIGLGWLIVRGRTPLAGKPPNQSRSSSASAAASSLPAQNPATQEVNVPSGHLDVVFFLSSDCEDCARVRTQVIPEIERLYAGRARVVVYDAARVENYALLRRYEDGCDSHEQTMLKMFFAGKYLAGADEIAAQSVSLIRLCLEEAGH